MLYVCCTFGNIFTDMYVFTVGMGLYEYKYQDIGEGIEDDNGKIGENI